MIYYHASPNKFDFPSWEHIEMPADKPAKAYLGFYVTPQIEFAQSLCGPENHLYEVVCPGAKILEYDHGEFVRRYNLFQTCDDPVAEYIQWRNILECDILALIESDGRCGELCIVNLECIKKFTELSNMLK